MLFEMSDRTKLIEDQLIRFMEEQVYPNERVVQEQIAEGGSSPCWMASSAPASP
jgi:hypothetical protein